MMYGLVINPAFYLVLQLVTVPLLVQKCCYKDVPPYAIVAGNPAKFVRYRFPQETIDKLENLAWWDWDISVIKEPFHYYSPTKSTNFSPHPKRIYMINTERASFFRMLSVFIFIYLQMITRRTLKRNFP